MKIQEYINNRNKYKIDYTYQRPSNAWSQTDKQCLIDTILCGEPMPIFFLNYKSDENVFYIVDGQQRLSCIGDFYDNKIKLSGKFSAGKYEGCTFNGNNALSDQDKANFLDYNLSFHIMEDYDDERVRLIFSRLQRGKALSLGEKLNAMPGSIVYLMRKLSDTNFMKKSIGISQDRYGVYPDSGRILFYETFGPKGCGTDELFKFFEDYKDMNEGSKEYKKAKSNLLILEKCFPSIPGNYKYLVKHAWVLAVYTMISWLNLYYVITGFESNIKDFVKSFHAKVYDETFRQSNIAYQRFWDNIRGGWSEKIMTLRRDVLVHEFLKKYEVPVFDKKRQLSDADKIAVFNRENGRCEECHIELKDYKAGEYHHRVRYADGGETTTKNISLLCDKCHDKIHGDIGIDLSVDIENDIENDD